MDNLDLKFYWSVFLRRLPYFLVMLALLTAIAVTVALILPPVYRSSASMLVEPQQIPGDLAQSTVPVNPFEQVQIIEQRLMTRANLLALADRIGLYADRAGALGRRPGRPTCASASSSSASPPTSPAARRRRAPPSSASPSRRRRRSSPTRAPTSSSTWCSRRTSSSAPAGPTTRCSSSRAEVERLPGRAQAQVRGDHRTSRPPNFEALPDSLVARRNRQILEQERLLAPRARGIGAEEPARHRGLGLRAHRQHHASRR